MVWDVEESAMQKRRVGIDDVSAVWWDCRCASGVEKSAVWERRGGIGAVIAAWCD